MANGHGGQRTPAKPAAVSSPGSGRRTDGGAGSKSQPLRVASGGRYGERQAAVQQQQAAPLATTGPTGGTGAPQPRVAPEGAGAGIFGPTTQPNASPSGEGGPRELMLEDPQMFLRVLYAEYPHPAISALLRRTGSNG